MPTRTAACSVVSSAGVLPKYVLQAVLMPKAFEPKSTVLAYMVRISFLVNSCSIFTAVIHSLLFMMRIFSPGIFPSNPVEYCVRTLNMFLANCCVMVDAPLASLCRAKSLIAAKTPWMSMPKCL